MTIKPVIGILLDKREKGDFSNYPYYAVTQRYFECIDRFGGVPIALPCVENGIGALLDVVDGLIVPGGRYALPAEWYVEGSASAYETPSRILDYSLDVIDAALERHVPFLGICAGMQLLAGLKGCRVNGNVEKHRINPVHEVAHGVEVVEESLLRRCAGRAAFGVNSRHLEAVVELADGVKATAHSPDGVIEAVELGGHGGFALGVQWHPEAFRDPGDPNARIVKAFIEAASAHKMREGKPGS